jgi:hypothetical protein
MPAPPPPLDTALRLAALGWHVFPLAPDKRPLANCPTCRERAGRPPHPIEACLCLPQGGWCHGVRAATTDPATLTHWWTYQPAAAIGIAAGPSRLVLIDIDTHGKPLPAHLATGLLPGIDLACEPINPELWNHSGHRDGRDTLRLLAQLRGGPRPWPTDPAHQPVTAHTPSGGRHLWYRAPAGQLHQALGALAWQVDIKAGWSYGLAPGTTTANGTYQHTGGDPAHPGDPPPWLTREITRVATPKPAPPAPNRVTAAPTNATGPANYLRTVIDRGAAAFATAGDGRKQSLAALAYKAGGYLQWSGIPETEVIDRLISAGTNSGLSYRTAERTARRSLDTGKTRPLAPPQRRS